jgi:hypothetical protein
VNLDDLFDHPLLALTLGPKDHHGYYGRRDVDGLLVAIVALTFGRARIVMIDRASDCPYDGW